MQNIISARSVPYAPCPMIVVRNVMAEEMYNDMLSLMPTPAMWDSTGSSAPMLPLREGSESSFLPFPSRWEKFYSTFAEIDGAVLSRFAVEIGHHLTRLRAKNLPVLGSATLCERTQNWSIKPHLHALNQLVQVMIYMPHSMIHPPQSDATRGGRGGTIFYHLKSPRALPTRDLFVWDDTYKATKGSYPAVLTFEENELEVAYIPPYMPNTLVAWVNTPEAIHASPVGNVRRRYALSCSVMSGRPGIHDGMITAIGGR